MDALWLVSLATFVGVTCLVLGLGLLTRGAPAAAAEVRLSSWVDVLQRQLRVPATLTARDLLAEPTDASDVVVPPWIRGNARFSRFLRQAGTSLSTGKFTLVVAAAAISGAAGAWVIDAPIPYIPLLASVAALVPLVAMAVRRQRRLATALEQLPDALDLLARSLRAGHGLSSAIQLVGAEFPEPIGGEFRRCHDEQHVGVPLEQSLDALAERLGHLEIRFFATAVILQRQTGGDLAELLDKIAALVRDRFRLEGQIRSLTAEGRLSGRILLSLPPLMFVLLWQIQPNYARVLVSDPAGQGLLALAVAWQLIGALMMRQMIQVRV